MAKGDQTRPRRPRLFRRKTNSAHNPVDEFTGIPTDPRFLVRQDGLLRDGRRGVGSIDWNPPYRGDLTQPESDPVE